MPMRKTNIATAQGQARRNKRNLATPQLHTCRNKPNIAAPQLRTCRNKPNIAASPLQACRNKPNIATKQHHTGAPCSHQRTWAEKDGRSPTNAFTFIFKTSNAAKSPGYASHSAPAVIQTACYSPSYSNQ